MRQQLEQKQLSEKLKNEYLIGVSALKVRDWTRAILAFEKVLEMDRNFRDARKRLAEAQSALERESTETIVARYYANGVAAMNRNDLGGALAALEKVHKINPNYRDVADLLEEVENKMQQQSNSSITSAPSSPSLPLDSLYQAALAFQEKEEWAQAVLALERLQLLQPNYRDVVDRLALARTNLNLSQDRVAGEATPESGSASLYVAGVLAGLIVLPVLGHILFSPVARARIQLFRGNYAAAAQIYERLLTRNPGRLKLYPALANIYLLLGRKDEQALKIFKIILKLNLASRNREEINAIVAQNYLTEGRTDADALEVLENELKARYQKQKP